MLRRAALAVTVSGAALLLGACSSGGAEPVPSGGTEPTTSVEATPRITDEAGRVANLQRALTGEHEAIYVYGAVAGPLGETGLDRVRAAIDEHRTRRDALTELLVAAEVTPVAGAATYPVGGPKSDATLPLPRSAVRTTLAELERELAEIYHLLAGATRLDRATAALGAAAELDSLTRAELWVPTPTEQPVEPSSATTTPTAEVEQSATEPVSP